MREIKFRGKRVEIMGRGLTGVFITRRLNVKSNPSVTVPTITILESTSYQ